MTPSARMMTPQLEGGGAGALYLKNESLSSVCHIEMQCTYDIL